MATLSPALQAKLAAIRAAKQNKDTQQLDNSGVNETVATTANQSIVQGSNATALVSTATAAKSTAVAVPNSQPAVIKPSLVTFEGAGEYEPFKMKLAELEQQLEDQVPGFAFTLRDIHRTLGSDANVITVLSEDEISIIVKGLARQMDTTVVVAKKSSTKRTQPVNADEL